MKELTFSIQNKQEQELSIVMQEHKVPITIVVGTSCIDLEMGDVDDLIKALHMMKSQHKTFVNVEPIGVQDLKKGEGAPSNRTNVYADLPTPPKVKNKKVETVSQIQLQVGQKYKDRKGNEFTVTSNVRPDSWQYEQGYRFFAQCELPNKEFYYTPNGRFISDGHDYDYDLVELIEDAPSQADKDDKGRWILNEGDTVMLSNGVEGMVIEKDGLNIPYNVGYYDNGQVQSEWLYGKDEDKHTVPYIYITSIVKRVK